jgi:putative membrane protein
MSVEPVGPSSNEMAHQRTDLACSRTLMAADRSLMAWVRTALSMISFGFTIYKVLEGFQKAGAVLHGVSPRSAGLFLTGLGTLAIVAGTVEYWHRAKAVRHLLNLPIWRPSFVIALILSATGLLLFLGIITRLL